MSLLNIQLCILHFTIQEAAALRKKRKRQRTKKAKDGFLDCLVPVKRARKGTKQVQVPSLLRSSAFHC